MLRQNTSRTHDSAVFAPRTGVVAICSGLKSGNQVVFAITNEVCWQSICIKVIHRKHTEMAKITASVYTSHVPAIGAALDLGKTHDAH